MQAGLQGGEAVEGKEALGELAVLPLRLGGVEGTDAGEGVGGRAELATSEGLRALAKELGKGGVFDFLGGRRLGKGSSGEQEGEALEEGRSNAPTRVGVARVDGKEELAGTR